MLYIVILVAFGVICFLILWLMIKYANNTRFTSVIATLLAIDMAFSLIGAVSVAFMSGVAHLTYNERKANAEKEYHLIVFEVEALSKMSDAEKIIYLANSGLVMRIAEWNDCIKTEKSKNKWDKQLDPNIYKDTGYINISEYIISQEE